MNFLRCDSESFGILAGFLDSWLDSKIPDLILKIPVYQIKLSISRDYNIRINTKFYKTINES